MNNKTNLKIKKYNMIMWSFLGAVSFIILILTILSLAGVLDVLFNPVLGILIPAVMVLSACSQIRAYFMETMFFFEKAQDSDKDAVMELLNAAKEDYDLAVKKHALISKRLKKDAQLRRSQPAG